MQNNRVWERACGLTATVVEHVGFDETAVAIIVSIRPDARARSRCGRCGRRSDRGDHSRLRSLGARRPVTLGCSVVFERRREHSRAQDALRTRFSENPCKLVTTRAQ